ncbi:MAG: efflux RND transporter periplasmic adaptor subunit [Bacteroidales bacterium]|nr:efflux RND transporter periplasmic adaptor subunit [Bacteroidales bacterium]MCL2133335.1 efflux RND transporter periplasmic adaptor subunit [Bacteroidales bacterium]
MRKRKIQLYVATAIIGAVLIIWLLASSGSDNREQTTKAKRGPFEIVVTTTGELEAQSMERIEGPAAMRDRNVRLGDVKILDMVPEGTVVEEGDYVATLDPSAGDTRLKDVQDELERLEAQYERTLLDTSLNLRGIRNNLVNLKFDLEEKEIAVEQSIYEPPATQRQAQNNLERAQRAYDQEVRNYTLKEDQAIAQVKDVQINLFRKRRELEEMENVLQQFVIRAPKSGMVIYYRDWSGGKRKVGSTISPWDLTVATLPDLSVMQSKTYINEIDISKIKKDQQVRVGIDAFPDKSYTGVVTEVSNIGEQLKNTDAKVFEVVVRVNESDPILRPAMTTSNQIITTTFADTLFIPIEALFGSDTLLYVYRTNGTRQVVVPGDMNENFVIITAGLKERDELFLSLPEKSEQFKLTGTELIPILKERVRQKEEEETTRKEKATEQRERRNTMRNGKRAN